MLPEGNNPPTAQPVSRLVIEFAAPGSAEMRMMTENVTPAQLLAAAGWIDWQARYALAMQAQSRQQNGIAVPGIALPRH